jgi:hypothetical protein
LFFVPLKKLKIEIMSINRNKSNLNHQDHPHTEGAQSNIPPKKETQRHTDNNSHAMNNMMNESPEQKAGPAHDQKDEGWVQKEERQP